MKKTLISLLLIAILCLSLFACKGNPITKEGSNPLVGNWVWEYEGLGEIMSFAFNEDMTGSISAFGESQAFTYTYTDTAISMKTDGEIEEIPYKLSGDTITMTFEGEEIELVKKGSSAPVVQPVATEASTDESISVYTEGTSASADDMDARFKQLGIDQNKLLLGSQDYLEMDEDGDFTLYTSADYEQVAKAVYDVCKDISDDGEVRDYWTEEPIDFTFSEDDFMIWYGYNRGGKFIDVALSMLWTDEATGINEYLMQWD